MRVHPHIIFIFILLLLLQGRSSSHARPVNKVFVTVLTNDEELALEGDSTSFSLQKEILPNAAKIGGRRMSVDKREKARKVSMALRRRKGEEAKNWKDNFMAFSADYRTPKPHPPKNN